MKSIIIYFSLTGNTKKVAKAIHKGMSQLVAHCDIATIKEVDIQYLGDYDLIGIGSPIWGGTPRNVRVFIDTLPLLQGKHAFAFSTHGAMPEKLFPEVVSLLAEKGLAVIGVRDWYGSIYVPGHPKPYPTDGHPDEIDLKEAEDFGKEMVELSRRISAGGPELIPPLQMRPIPPPDGHPRAPKPQPKLNTQKCRYPECRLCMDNCPQDAIDLSVSPPVFAKKCWTCYFCEMICPEGAVEVDYTAQAKATIWRCKNVYAKALDDAEAEGRFRRLVPREDVDWDTPYYKIYNTHPRYVIPEESC
ncbi:flavodoxin family protein [Chloroflexota bacterium]